MQPMLIVSLVLIGVLFLLVCILSAKCFWGKDPSASDNAQAHEAFLARMIFQQQKIEELSETLSLLQQKMEGLGVSFEKKGNLDALLPHIDDRIKPILAKLDENIKVSGWRSDEIDKELGEVLGQMSKNHEAIAMRNTDLASQMEEIKSHIYRIDALYAELKELEGQKEKATQSQLEKAIHEIDEQLKNVAVKQEAQEDIFQSLGAELSTAVAEIPNRIDEISETNDYGKTLATEVESLTSCVNDDYIKIKLLDEKLSQVRQNFERFAPEEILRMFNVTPNDIAGGGNRTMAVYSYLNLLRELSGDSFVSRFKCFDSDLSLSYSEQGELSVVRKRVAAHLNARIAEEGYWIEWAMPGQEFKAKIHSDESDAKGNSISMVKSATIYEMDKEKHLKCVEKGIVRT